MEAEGTIPTEIESVCVYGLGYIGLPTAAFFASSGLKTLGVDVLPQTVDKVNSGELPFKEIGLEELLQSVIESGTLKARPDPSPAHAHIVAVPTPFNADKSVDDKYVLSAAESIAKVLAGGELIILESTSPPGMTEKMIDHILSLRPDLTIVPGQSNSIYGAHCPERVLPGKIMEEMVSNDRIVGGINTESTEIAIKLYKRFCDGEVVGTDARTAELTKLTENSFRDVNIAFANELSMICDDLGVNVWELIRLANRHPRVNILQPGPGVGGHCIAVDPWFIYSAAPSKAKLIQASREVNDSKPQYVLNRIERALICANSAQPTIAILGITFKPDIDDLRESPSLEIASQVANNHPDSHVLIVEPNISRLPNELSRYSNVEKADLASAAITSDVAVLLVDHREFRLGKEQIAKVPTIVDTRGLISSKDA